jgi:TolB-like protein/DNA-binding winged helix-turn-helix (wHTH) protein
LNDLRKIRIGEWTVSPANNLLERAGVSRKLETRAMDVLVVLARHAGEVVAVDALLTSVWKGVVVGDGSVYFAINQLRQALDGPDTSHIETIPKRGYRLTVPVAFCDEEAAVAPPDVPIAPARPAPRALRWLAAAGAAAAFIVMSTWLVLRSVTDRATVASVAVLPFENLSTDVDQQYFADGVTEELIDSLTRIRELKVTGRASAFRFEAGGDAASVGAVLGVEHIIEGSVRRAGDDIRVAARLIDVGSGRHVWARTYERRVDDIFAIQDEIAAAVAAALEVTLGVGDVGRRPGMTHNVDAYDEYLRALSLHLRFEPTQVPLAVEHLERAVAIDPTFSVAWALLNNVCANAALIVPERADDWRAKAAEALERARSLSPDAPDVLVRSSIDLIERGRWLEAAAVHARAVGEFSSSGIGGEAAAARGYLLLSAGRVREAIGAFEQARAIDPLVPAYSYGLGSAYLAATDLDAALDEADRGLELGGFGPLLRSTALMAALSRGDRAEIGRRLDALAPIDAGADVDRELGALIDDPAAAVAEVRLLASTSGILEKPRLAQWAAHFGEPELALEILAGVPRYLLSNGTLWRPAFREVRKLPGFKDVVRRFGLVDYWRVYGWSDLCRPVGSDDFACV